MSSTHFHSTPSLRFCITLNSFVFATPPLPSLSFLTSAILPSLSPFGFIRHEEDLTSHGPQEARRANRGPEKWKLVRRSCKDGSNAREIWRVYLTAERSLLFAPLSAWNIHESLCGVKFRLASPCCGNSRARESGVIRSPESGLPWVWSSPLLQRYRGFEEKNRPSQLSLALDKWTDCSPSAGIGQWN